jgi:sporulation protein YqfD
MFKPTTEITISGLNLERKLNMLAKCGISVLSVTRVGRKECKIVVHAANRQQTVDLLSEKWYNDDGTVVINPPKTVNHGLARGVELLRKHLALVLIVALLLPLLLFTSNFCLDIKVNSTLEREIVVDSLGEYGIKIGSKINNLDKDRVENHLTNALDVSYAVVDVKGSVLYVTLYDKDDGHGLIDLTDPSDIVAHFAGTVSRIVVLQGTARVKVGDKVRKGQTLIKGVRTFSDGHTEPVKAVGEVYATVEVSETMMFSPTVMELTDTGEIFRMNTVTVGKIEVAGRKIPFELYRSEYTVTTLYPFNIKITTFVLYEQQEKMITVEFADILEQMKRDVYNLALKKADFTVAESSYIVKNGVSVKVVLRGTKLVSVEK